LYSSFSLYEFVDTDPKDVVDIEKINAEDCYSSRPMTPRMYLNSLKPEQLKVPVYQVHFLQAVAQIVPSVSTSELVHYEKLRDQYSSRATC
jgi:peroxin-6